MFDDEQLGFLAGDEYQRAAALQTTDPTDQTDQAGRPDAADQPDGAGGPADQAGRPSTG